MTLKLQISNKDPGLPISMDCRKYTKNTSLFPPLRPICSGFNSCTAKISEFIDAYLKPLAQNTSSFIKDTSDFVERIESDVAPTTISSKTILATMDVSSSLS